MALAIAVPGPGGGSQAIATSTTAITVVEADAGTDAEPAEPGATDAEGEIPIGVWLVGIGVLVAVGLVARRVLADL